jgi:hypothetical protein
VLTAGAAARADTTPETILLGGETASSRLLLDQLGQAVLQVLHPLCRHTETKRVTATGAQWSFTTDYAFGKRPHRLVWVVVLERGLVVDVQFTADTNPVPTAKLATKAREKIAPLVRAHLNR